MVGTLQIEFDAKAAGPALRHGTQIAQDRIQRSLASTANEAAATILRLGRANISAAGKFGTRWTQGLHADVLINPVVSSIQVWHEVPYFMIFERGGIIQGKPLLWIPLSFASDAQGKRARDFPGGLFRVDRKSGGAPLLLSIRDKQPKYFGKTSVNIPQKFHIRDIARKVGNSLRDIYSKFFRSDVGG
jgi:hypothetical protein